MHPTDPTNPASLFGDPQETINARNRRLAEALAFVGGGKLLDNEHGDHYFTVEFTDMRLGVSAQDGKKLRVTSRPATSDHRRHAMSAPTTTVAGERLSYSNARQSPDDVAREILKKIGWEAREDFEGATKLIMQREEYEAKTARTIVALGLPPKSSRDSSDYWYVNGSTVRIHGDSVDFDRVYVGIDKARRIIAILQEK